MLVPGLQTASLSRMTSGSNTDYSRVYESLCECAQEMLDKYRQKQIHTEKLKVKIKAVEILLHELRKIPEDSATTCKTILFALKSHAEALQGHEHLLSVKGNTYALLEQTSGLRERHGDTRASLLWYHDLKNKLLGPDTPLGVDQKALHTWAENKTLTLETLFELDQFQKLWADLSRKTLLGSDDFQLLIDYKEYMTTEHIANILQRVNASIASWKLEPLRQLLSKK